MEHLDFRPTTPPPLGMSGEALFRQHGQLRHCRRQTLLYSPGDEASQACLVLRGEVKLSRYSPEGRELTLGHLGPGELFGELEIMADTPRQSQATTRLDSDLLVLDRAALLHLVDSTPDFAGWLARHTVTRQFRMENRLESLLFKSANGKVAQVLLNLAREHGRPVRGGTLIDYPITHQEIGNLIATTRETVSYAFMDFREQGLISTLQRRTVVLDEGGLAEAALA